MVNGFGRASSGFRFGPANQVGLGSGFATISGDKHDILPQTVYESRCHGQLAGWLANLILEDEVRPDLDLPLVVCEYEDVFPNELPGLPP